MILSSNSCHYLDNRILITLYITHKCNFVCHYCYDKKNRNNKDMSIDNIKLLLENIKLTIPDREFQIHVIGGEPTQHPYFEEILLLLNTYDFIKEIWVTTNGTFDIKKLINIKNILGEKLLIITSFHPGNKSHNIEFYEDIFTKYKENNFKANIPFMLDTNINFDLLIEYYNRLNVFGFEVRTCTLEPTTKYVYEEKYNDWINDTFFETNRFLEITYEDNSKKNIPLSEIYKTYPNPFLGWYRYFKP